MSPENGIWKGCGHKVKAIMLCDDPLCIAPYIEFLQDNPKELCYDCWKKEKELGDGQVKENGEDSLH